MEVPSSLFSRTIMGKKNNFTKIGGRVPHPSIQRFHDPPVVICLLKKQLADFEFGFLSFLSSNTQIPMVNYGITMLWVYAAAASDDIFWGWLNFTKSTSDETLWCTDLKHLSHQQKTIESQPMKILFCTRSQSQNWWFIKYIPSL